MKSVDRDLPQLLCSGPDNCLARDSAGTRAIWYELATHRFRLETRGGLLTIRVIKFHLFQGQHWEWKNLTAFGDEVY